MTSPLIVRYGGGVNSLAMLVGLRERGQRPDAVVFSDKDRSGFPEAPVESCTVCHEGSD